MASPKSAASMAGRVPTSIWTRKLDLLYLCFFIIHVPVMLSVDLAPYYSTSLRPAYTVSLREYYIRTYRDRFFTHPPAWFHAYMALEVVYHIPISLWAIVALVQGRTVTFAWDLLSLSKIVIALQYLDWIVWVRNTFPYEFDLGPSYLHGNDNPMIPLQLLIFALETGVTTLTCIAEMLSWEGYTRQEQARLAALYVPYLGLAVLIGTDMFVRLKKVVLKAENVQAGKKHV